MSHTPLISRSAQETRIAALLQRTTDPNRDLGHDRGRLEKGAGTRRKTMSNPIPLPLDSMGRLMLLSAQIWHIS